MTSEIRANKQTNRVGLGTVEYTNTGIIVSGIVTCTELSGLTALNIAGVGTANTLDINGDIDVDGHTNLDNVSVAGVTTFSSDLNVAENIIHTGDTDTKIRFADAGNIIQLQAGGTNRIQTTSTGAQIDTILLLYGAAGNPGRLRLQEGGALSEIMVARNSDSNSFLYFKTEISGTTATRVMIDESGHFRPNADSTNDLGITGTRWRNVFADTYYGDGSNLTGITGTTINNNADNRIITGSGTANTLEGESTLTYDGNKLKFGGGSRTLDNGYYDDIVIDNSDTSSGAAGGSGISIISGTSSWGGLIFGDADNHQQGYIKYNHQDEFMQLVTASGVGQVRIESGGSVGITSCIHHLSDTDTNFGFPSNDSYIVRIAGNSRIYTNNSEPIWHRRDVSAGVSTQTMLLNYNNASGSGCALAFAPSTNYASRHSSIEVVNEGNNNMSMRFKVTDANQNPHAIERMRITKDGDVGVGEDSPNCRLAVKDTAAHATYANATPTVGNCMLQLYNNPSSEAAGHHASMQLAINGGSQNRVNTISAVAETNNSRHTATTFCTDDGGSRTEKLRITSEGNLIIGHTSGSNKLQIGNTGHSGYCIAANSPSYGAVIQVGDGATPGTAAALWIRNLNNGGGTTACFRVQGDGTTHFGDQTSTGKYNDGNTGASWYDAKDSWQQAQSGTLGWSMMYMNKIGGSDNRIIQFNSGGSNIGYISRSGSNVVFQTSSDYRLKKDVVALPNGIERVKQLRPVAFKWIKDDSDMEGFLAHEAQEICPYAVSGHKDEVALEDHGDRKKGDMIVQAVDYGEFTPLLTAAMKELIAKVETLEAKVAALGG